MFSSGDGYIDFGAQFVQCLDDSPVYELTKANGLDEEESSGDPGSHLFYTQHGELVERETVQKVFAELLRVSHKKLMTLFVMPHLNTKIMAYTFIRSSTNTLQALLPANLTSA